MAEEKEKELSKMVQENAEIAATFELMEKYSKEKPAVFNYFLQQYQPFFFKGMDLFYLLFGHFSEQSEGWFKKLFPFFAIGLLAINLIILALKK